LSICNKVAHTEAINQLTISLKQKFKIKLPDALIAATAIHADLPLLTYDKAFAQISTLDIVLLEL
jgi:predicted nucleic acid-binding protein